jgi:hypothetical protein
MSTQTTRARGFMWSGGLLSDINTRNTLGQEYIILLSILPVMTRPELTFLHFYNLSFFMNDNIHKSDQYLEEWLQTNFSHFLLELLNNVQIFSIEIHQNCIFVLNVD